MQTCEKNVETAACEIKLEDIRLSSTKVCFVCTGNTCRSPMAAAVLNHYGAKYGFKAESAGLYAVTGEPITPAAEQVLRDAQIADTPENNYSAHRSRVICEETVRSCDIIVGISDSHMMALITMFPAYASKITSLPKNISDPYGGDAGVYAVCLGEITSAVRDMFKLND
ncbi:MAG: hypothetical protein WCQ72_03110 [Eubacteriales bacterium]